MYTKPVLSLRSVVASEACANTMVWRTSAFTQAYLKCYQAHPPSPVANLSPNAEKLRSYSLMMSVGPCLIDLRRCSSSL